jgi:hypothetical protein
MTECTCDRCGQLMRYDAGEHFYSDALCGPCLERDRAPQGEAMALFTPAPATMAGQTHMEV